MAHTPNNMMFMENQRNSDVEISMLPSPSPMSKKFRRTSGSSWKSVLGFKWSNFVLTVVIGIIIVIEIKIMYETTKTYNESLVSQLSQKNEILERTLINLTGSNNDRNELLEQLLKLNEEFKDETMNRTGKVEDKIQQTQELVVQLTKENKLMYSTGEKNFMETLKLVREALTMNTNTVIRLLDENVAIQTKLHQLEESVSSSHRRRSQAWTLTSAASGFKPTSAAGLVILLFLASR